MPKTAQVQKQTTIQGTAYPTTRTVTSDNLFESEPSSGIPAAKTGALSTRTNNTDGTLTMDPGHGITTGARFDLYWSGGSRVGCIAGTVSVNSVPFSLGSGDNLPAQSTAIRTAIPQVESGLSVVGANVALLLAYAALVSTDYPGYVAFLTSGDVEIKSYKVTGLLNSIEWDSDDGTTNPVTGQTIAKVAYSHGNIDAVRTMGSALMYN